MIAQTELKKGLRFTTSFGSDYEVVKVMPKSSKVAVKRLKSGLVTHWPIAEVLEQNPTT